MPEVTNKLKEHRFVASTAFQASIAASNTSNSRPNVRPKPTPISSKSRQKSYQDSIAFADDGKNSIGCVITQSLVPVSVTDPPMTI